MRCVELAAGSDRIDCIESARGELYANTINCIDKKAKKRMMQCLMIKMYSACRVREREVLNNEWCAAGT